MSTWLYDRILEVDIDRQPAFSNLATSNWFRALRFEVDLTHGFDLQDQFRSCRAFYKNSLKVSKKIPPLAPIFEPLFYSVIYCMSLETFSQHLSLTPWIQHTAIVDWYYAIYFSARAIFAALGRQVEEDHSKSANAYVSTVRKNLPYPFDMVAQRVTGEEYRVFLSAAPKTAPYNLYQRFEEERSVAQGMLFQYLNGSAKWYVRRTKDNILRKNPNISNFRTKVAREIRDKQLKSEIGFLHCAYRQRVKANYRDSIYLSYSSGDTGFLADFIDNISATAKFSSIVAVALIERRIGEKHIKSFVADLNENLTSGNYVPSESEKFWKVFK